MNHHPSNLAEDAAPYEAEVLEIVQKILAWRSTRLFALVLVLIAIVIGAYLRFHRLARVDMNGDEGASWAAASAPSVQQVAKIEQQLDPGKFALYDVMLHEWIGVLRRQPVRDARDVGRLGHDCHNSGLRRRA